MWEKGCRNVVTAHSVQVTILTLLPGSGRAMRRASTVALGLTYMPGRIISSSRSDSQAHIKIAIGG